MDLIESKPRVKPIYPVYRVTDHLIRIGAQLGITTQFDDPEGHVWSLLQLMDGTRTLASVIKDMQLQFSSLSKDDVLEGVERLDHLRILESYRDTVYDQVNDQAHRYIGNVNYFSRFLGLAGHRDEHQNRLSRARVVLLGLGGAGATVLMQLAGLGIGEIVAVDYDRVELSNLNRQFFYQERHIGYLKTRAAAEIMAGMNSSIRFYPINQFVASCRDIRPLLEATDLVISMIDEPPFLAMRRVNRATVDACVPCLYGAMQVTRGRVFATVPGVSGCFDCLHIYYEKTDPLFAAQFHGFHAAHVEHVHIAYAPNIFSLCGRIVDEAVRMLTGYLPLTACGKQLELNFETGESRVIREWPRYADECPTCGNGTADRWSTLSSTAGSL